MNQYVFSDKEIEMKSYLCPFFVYDSSWIIIMNRTRVKIMILKSFQGIKILNDKLIITTNLSVFFNPDNSYKNIQATTKNI